MKKYLPWIGLIGLVAGAIGWFGNAAYTTGQVRGEQARDHADLAEIMKVWRSLEALPPRVEKVEKVVETKATIYDAFLSEQRQINANLTEASKRQEETTRQLISTWNQQSAALSANGQAIADIKEMISQHMRQDRGPSK